MFTVDNHEKDILAVGCQNKTIQTQEKWNHPNLINVQYLLGTNHHLPLSHMAKIYIWFEEKNKRINEFSIGYTINLNLNANKAFKDQVTKCMKNTFGEMTKQHIGKILSKKNKSVSIIYFL